MADRYRVEAWSLPLATSTKTVQEVPFITGSFSDPVSDVGRGALTVRGDWDRLTDVDDPDNGVSSYYRVFQDNFLIGGFFGHRTSTEMADIGNKIVTIEGAAQGKIMEFARVENFDYPVRPSVETDWNFGSGAAGGLQNGGMEEQTGSVDFEDEKLGGFATLTGNYFKSNDVGPDVDDADAQTGSFSLFWDPGVGPHAGVGKFFTVEGGGTYTFSIYLKSTTTLKRFTMGTDFPTGSSSAGTTNPYVFSGDLYVELDNVPRNSAKDGTPGGDTDGTWQPMSLTITYPEFDSDPDKNSERIKVWVTYDHHNEGNGPVARLDTFVATGPGLGIQPWHRTSNASVVTVFEQSTDQVLDDTFSAKVTTTAADHGIAQVVEDLVAGLTYTFEAWVYHEEGSNQNFTLHLKHETGGSTSIATNTVSVPTATWTRITVTGVADDDDITVVIRKQNAATFYVDRTDFFEGQPSTAWGEINQQLLDDAAVDHTGESGRFIRDTLGFLDYTSFGALDSDSNTWVPALVEYRAVRGKRYDQIQSDGLQMGFEWEVVDSGTGFALNIYNKYDFTTRTGGIGTDRRNTNVPAIKFGAGIKAGPLISSATGANRIHAEGEDFRWDVRRDATAIGNYDTREGYEGNVNLLGDNTLGIVANQILDRTVIPTKGIKIVIDPKDEAEVPQPYVDLFPGDTYPINLIGLFTGDKRVIEITTDFTAGTAVWTVEFDQSSYTSDPLKSVVKAVQLLLDAFDELRFQEKPDVGAIDDHTHPKESIPTILVAASNARTEVQNMADFICSGTDDEVEIQAAIRVIAGLDEKSGRLVLSEGRFNVASDFIDFNEAAGDTTIWLMGMGYNHTFIDTNDSTGTIITVDHQTIISDVLISSASSVGTLIGIGGVGAQVTIRNTWVALMPTGIQVDGEQWTITECVSTIIGGDVIATGFITDLRCTNNIWLSGAINLDNATDVRIADNQLKDDVYGSPVEKIVIQNNDFLSTGSMNTHRIELDDAINSPIRIVIQGNVMEDVGFGGIRLNGVDDSIVQGNFIEGTGLPNCMIFEDCNKLLVTGNYIAVFVDGHGIVITDTNDSIFADNLINEPGQDTDNTYDAIILTNSDRNQIHGNKFIPAVTISPRYGINISTSTCDDNRIGDNDYGILANYGTFPLNDAGTGTKYPTARTADMSQSGVLTTGTGVARYPISEPSIMIDAHATVGTAPSGGPVTLDINKNGATMYGTATNPSVANGANVGNKAPADQTTFATNDYITLDLDAVNSAEDLTCVVRFLIV